MNDTRDIEPHPHFFRGLFSTLALMALLLAAGAFVVAFAAALSGCATEGGGLPPGALEFVTNHFDSVISGAGGASSVEESVVQNPGGDAGDAAAPDVFETQRHGDTEAAPAPDGSAPLGLCVEDNAAISWKYGGFDGSKAAEDPATQIRDLKLSGDGLSYKWAKGDLSNWGLSKTDAGALACAFWWDGSRWVGGKFDWISTSRTTRDFKNIRGRYHGWDPDRFFAAKRRAFCIISKDGKRRTNLLEE